MAIKKWVIDPMHSEISFKIKHLMISSISGSFDIFTADVETEEENFMNSKITFSADVNSITTKNEQRDSHLKSADFFDVANYPKINFTATSVANIDNDGSYDLYGDLSIKGVTKNIKLGIETGGIVKDAYGNTRAGFTIYGKINRKEFDLNWNAALEAGGIVVGDDVRIECNIQLIEQQ